MNQIEQIFFRTKADVFTVTKIRDGFFRERVNIYTCAMSRVSFNVLSIVSFPFKNICQHVELIMFSLL